MRQNKEIFPQLLYNRKAYSTPPRKNPKFVLLGLKMSFSAYPSFPEIWEHTHGIFQPAALKIRMKFPLFFSEQTYFGISPTTTAAVATKAVTCCFHSKCFPCICLLATLENL